jgi:ABC-type multidrug transport system ATPase subunit
MTASFWPVSVLSGGKDTHRHSGDLRQWQDDGSAPRLRFAEAGFRHRGILFRKPSFLFQDDRLLPWSSALENLTALGIPPERAKEYLAKVGLAGEEEKLPEELSGGMKRRLAIARCFAHGGDVFYLDEPLQGLDIKTAGDVLAFMAGETARKNRS